MKKYFLITRENKQLLSYVFPAIKKDFEIRSNKKVEFLNYKPKFKINFFIISQLLKLFVLGYYFDNHRFVSFKVKNCNLGRYVLSSTYSHLGTHFNFFYFHYFKIKYLIEGLNIIHFSLKNFQKISAIYIDHSVYINGLFLNFFSTKNIYAYTHNYPRGLFVKKFSSGKTVIDFEDFTSLKKNKSKKVNVKKIKKFLYNKMKPNFSWPWLIDKNLKKGKIKSFELKNFDFLIYCHAFTDAQLQCGYAGFIKYEDWLDYTLGILNRNKKKVLIKIHPNFSKKSKHYRSRYELKIFYRIKEKYKNNTNFLFIDEPYNNFEFLKNLKSNCLLISHHGTAIIEGALLGFKIISFYKGFWDNKFKITNTWKSKDFYAKLLSYNYSKYHFSNEIDFYDFTDKLIFNKYGTFGNKYFLKPIANYFKVKVSDLDNGLVKLRNFNLNNKNDLKLSKKIMNCIETI